MRAESRLPPSPPGLAPARFHELDGRLRPLHETAIVLLASAAFLALAVREAARQTYPFFDDVTYLHLGNQVRALGGPLGLLRALFAGTFEESNRHPLYLAFLGLIAHPTAGYHRAAQALTIALGEAALLSCWWTARRHLGRSPAALLALFLAVSRTFVGCAAREGCEPLLVAIWAQALGAILDGLRDGGAPGRARTGSAWLRAGFWSGLAFLTKGTGMFLPVSLALTFLIRERLRALLDRRAWTFGLAFLVTASPLLVRNLRLYGSPLYNWNTHTLWQNRLPDFAETFAPQVQALPPHTFADYLHHLTASALLQRIGVGLGETTFLVADALAPVGGISDANPLYIALVLLGATAAIIALRWLWRRANGFTKSFLFVHAAWSYFFIFVFSVNGGNTRYFLPLAATVLFPALASCVSEDIADAGTLWRSRWGRATLALSAVAFLAALWIHPPRLWKPGMEGARDFMAQHLRPGDVYAIDARSHLQPQWVAPQASQIIVSASWQEKPVEPSLMLDYLRRRKVRFLLIDGSSTAHMARPGDPAGRRYFFYSQLPLEPDGSLPLQGFPPELTPVYVDPGSPRRFLVLETAWGRPRQP